MSDSTATSGGTKPWRSQAILFGACGLVALLGFISRRPEQWTTPQFWAEDGLVFFSGAVTSGASAVLAPYAGYLHLVPRLVAWIASPLPWEYLPLAYTFAAAIVAAAVVARIATAELPPLARWLGAAAMVGVPHSGEVFLNLTNLNWILAGLLMVNLVEAAPNRAGSGWRRALEVIIAGLSGPMCVCLAPFAVLWMVRARRERWARPVTGAWLAVIAVQATLWLTSSRSSSMPPEMLVAAVPALLPRYALALFVGRTADHTLVLGYVVTTIAVLLVGVLLYERANRNRMTAIGMFATAAMLIVAGRAAGQGWPNPAGNGGRYTYIPFVLVLWGFAWLAAGALQTRKRMIALALYVCAIAASVSGWRARPMTQFNWPAQVKAVREGALDRFAVPPNWFFPVPAAGQPALAK